MIKYSIIIPTYNHLDDCLKPCIESLFKYTNFDNKELCIVANGCKDNTRQYLDELKNNNKNINIIWDDNPLGYARAVNLGVQASSGEYLVLLNNDTILLDQPIDSWINILEEPFKQDTFMGCTGPIKQKSVTLKEFIIFFCAMTRRRIWDLVGGLDPIFGVGAGEDTDYCHKIQNLGYVISQVPYNNKLNINQNFCVGEFPIWHKGEATVSELENWEEIFNNNTNILIDRYLPSTLVIVPAYNAESTIRKTLESILAQTYTNYNILIINDASTDNTENIILDYSKNEKIFYHKNDNRIGVSNSRNRGLETAEIFNYDLIAYCDADDWWEADHLSNSIECMNATFADLVYSKMIYLDINGNRLYPNWYIPEKFDSELIKRSNYIWISSVVHKRNNYRFDDDVNSLEDWSIILQHVKDGKKIISTEKQDVNYLVRENTNASRSKEVFATFMEKHKDIVPIKLNLGCGDDILDGWINIDAYSDKAQVKVDIRKLPYEDNYADVILVSHVIEHFKFHEAFEVLKEWKRVLKDGGKLIIETPDLLATCKDFVESDEQWRIRLYGHFFAFPELPGQVHYFLYTESQLGWTLSQCGLKNIQRIPPDSTYSRCLPNKQHIFLRMICEK